MLCVEIPRLHRQLSVGDLPQGGEGPGATTQTLLQTGGLFSVGVRAWSWLGTGLNLVFGWLERWRAGASDTSQARPPLHTRHQQHASGPVSEEGDKSTPRLKV